VLVIGDFGSGTEAEMDVAAAVEKVAIDRDAGWLLTVGDNFYSDDIDLIWNQPYGWVAERGLRVIGVLGNHDIESDSRRELNRRVLGIEEPWSQAVIGGAKLLALDSNQASSTEQLAFIDDTLDPPIGNLGVAALHHPPYSCSRHGDTSEIRDSWVPHFEAGRIDLVLSGHDHNYQRLERGDITYVVDGGGGQRLYPAEPCGARDDPPLASDYEHNSFLVLTIGEESIAGEALSSTGELIDSFSIP
jgi:predicted phosphodiesterase